MTTESTVDALTIDALMLCILISFSAYHTAKFVFCRIRNFLKNNLDKKHSLTEWQRGFYFAEEEIAKHAHGFINIEDILHEAAMDNTIYDEYYTGMSDYLELYYKRRCSAA